MIISYKKRSINFNLVYGLFHMVLAFIMMYVEEHLLMTYFWMAFSVLCIINYYFQKTYQYLSIENGIIKINEPFGKKLKLSEIQKIKKNSRRLYPQNGTQRIDHQHPDHRTQVPYPSQFRIGKTKRSLVLNRVIRLSLPVKIKTYFMKNNLMIQIFFKQGWMVILLSKRSDCLF
jgi:hypothetical protein